MGEKTWYWRDTCWKFKSSNWKKAKVNIPSGVYIKKIYKINLGMKKKKILFITATRAEFEN